MARVVAVKPGRSGCSRPAGIYLCEETPTRSTVIQDKDRNLPYSPKSERRCRRLRNLKFSLGPGQDPGPGRSPGLTPGAAPAPGPGNVATALGLVPALAPTPRPTGTTPPGTIRTTEGASGATTAATGGRSTTGAGTAATTREAITRTEAEDTTTSPTGRVEAAAEEVEEEAAGEAGTTAATTRTTTAPAGGAHAPARPRSGRAVAAALATPTARRRADPGTPSTPASLRGPDPRPGVATTRRKAGERKRKTRG